MAIKNDFPILDGIEPSWADISVKLSPSAIQAAGFSVPTPGGALFEVKDIYAVNTSRSVEVGKKRGASGGRVMGRTTGQGDQEASITFYRSGFQNFLRTLAAVAPVRGNQRIISLVKFDFTIEHTPPGSLEILKRIVRGCRYIGDTMNNQEGSDAQQVEAPLDVMEIADVVDGQEIVLL